MASPNDRFRGRGCPYCSNKKVLPGFNDLATTNPELAAEADGWDPTTLTANSGKKVGWRCKLGHTWISNLDNRSKGNGCPICSGNQVLAGYNDLATTNPELAAQADGWDPSTLSAFTHRKVGWRCSNNHTYQSTVSNRSLGDGCPICSGRQVLAGYNDLATTDPELAAQADGWDPGTLTSGSGKTVGWRCVNGHAWKAVIASRSAGNQCPVCANQRVLAGYNDLATTDPELAAQADGWDPRTLTAHSGLSRGWRCTLGHTWKAPPNTRSRGVGCPVCSNKALLVGFNDLATTNPELAAEADGWDPTTLVAGSNKKVAWKCGLGHTWKAILNSRSSGRGCPSCATYGFDPNKEGWLYFIENDALEMLQIGITNVLEDRLGRHALRGWEVIEVRGPMDGSITTDLETAILQALRRRGAVLGHKAGIEKFDGYSEAWTKDSLQVTGFKQLLDWVYEADELKN